MNFSGIAHKKYGWKNYNFNQARGPRERSRERLQVPNASLLISEFDGRAISSSENCPLKAVRVFLSGLQIGPLSFNHDGHRDHIHITLPPLSMSVICSTYLLFTGIDASCCSIQSSSSFSLHKSCSFFFSYSILFFFCSNYISSPSVFHLSPCPPPSTGHYSLPSGMISSDWDAFIALLNCSELFSFSGSSPSFCISVFPPLSFCEKCFKCFNHSLSCLPGRDKT